MQASGKIQTAPGMTYDFTSEDMQDLGEIGRGAYGAVNKMIFRRTNTTMAGKIERILQSIVRRNDWISLSVKRIRSTVDEKEQKQLLMDLEVVMNSNDCNYIVQFYGALFKEV